MDKAVVIDSYSKTLVGKEFNKRLTNRKLMRYNEYKNLSFSTAVTSLLSVIFILNTYSIFSKNINEFFLYLSIYYSISLILQISILTRMRKEIINNDEISKTTRLSGFLMLPFVFCGNFFVFVAGCVLIKKEATIEYQIGVYMILSNICILLISMLNVFKQYVANRFLLGMTLLAVVLIFHTVATIIIAKNISVNTMNNKLVWLCIPLLVSGITGNLFSILLAIVIFSRYKKKRTDDSIKWIDILRRLFRNQMATTGFFIVVLLLSLSIYSNLTFEEAVAIQNDYSNLLVSPNIQFPFGTDEFGRCVFTRIIIGARISLIIGISATTFSMLIGATLGAFSGYYGGRLDNIVMRGIDILNAIPGILLSMVIIAGLGANIPNLIIALGISSIPSYARITRSTVLNMANQEFVEAAKACGANDRIIIFKHILLNSMAPIIVNTTIGIGSIVLATSALSYLGIGIPPHIPEWGNVLRMGSAFLETKPYLAIFPGLAIMTIVLAFNFFGDGLRDALDPKMK